ncbi:MAG: hypothetical protein K2M48_07070, partial [Clostridiales bacterium]|nr:hypothetical protein [Clostridiales bacterium]
MAGVIALTTVRSIRANGNFITKKNLLYLAPTFLIIYLLHLTAAVFNHEEIDFFYCFSLIYTSLDVMKFKAAKSMLMPICNAYPLYYVDFVLAFIIGGITVIMSVASFFGVRISNFGWTKHLLNRDCDVVIGDSDTAVKYAKNTKNSVLLGAGISSQRYVDLIKQGIHVLRIPLAEKQLSRKLKHGAYSIVVFRDANYSYTSIIETLMSLADKVKIKIYLEANQQEMKILKEKFIKKADNVENAYISGFNKYELMARRFVVDNPITKYIPRSFYNDNFSVKSDKKIHVVFIGFGKVNYQLFRMCAMQYQFVREQNGKLATHPVCYHIYDNNDQMLHNEFFTRIQYEFNEVFADCDFKKPENICELNDIKQLDINSVEAKKTFKSLVSPDSFTYFIISLDNDLEDASYAQTVNRLLDDDDNYRIFVRAKNNSGERLNETNDGIIYFGEARKLYTHGNIIN